MVTEYDFKFAAYLLGRRRSWNCCSLGLGKRIEKIETHFGDMLRKHVPGPAVKGSGRRSGLVGERRPARQRSSLMWGEQR